MKNGKYLLLFDDMFIDMLSNKNFNQTVNKLFIKSKN